ncbi:MAG TPA: hypothetical protein VGQ21_10215 [Thermoanaerobaculia bacterium]|jgi:hypothetical protein|nr:hypothetical protein [Thermoanaerobaculia bacterium]
MAEPSIRPTFGDNVTIRSTPETEAAGLAGKTGSVSGFTTPSVTGVQVLGARDEDYALAVMFDDDALPNTWFAEELVEFHDHAVGTEIRMGNMKAVRAEDGSWVETRLDGTPLASRTNSREKQPWWKWW